MDVWFPEPALGANTSKVSTALAELAGVDEVRKVRREVISIEIDLNVAPISAADAYLRLHLLSHRLIKPHGAVMDGIFGLLANVVLTHDVAQRDNLRVGRHDGVVAVVETLKGHPLFAHVTLTRSERSPIAALVTEMLEGPIS